MSQLFSPYYGSYDYGDYNDFNDFNEDLSNWDTSWVTDMRNMFQVRCGLHLEPPCTLLEHSLPTITILSWASPPVSTHHMSHVNMHMHMHMLYA